MRRAVTFYVIGLLCLCQWVLGAVPAAPSELQCAVSGNRIDLYWVDNSHDEIGFVLERQVDSSPFTVLNNTLYANADHYADEALQYGHIYTYRLYAYNLEGNSSYSNTSYGDLPPETFTVRLELTSDVDDTFLDVWRPDMNYGDLSVGDSDSRYLFKYNFPSELTGKRIINADLYIYAQGHSGQWSPDLFMDLYRVTRDWDAMQATWDNALTSELWGSGGGDYDKKVGQIRISDTDVEDGEIDPTALEGGLYYPPADITDIVKRWVRGEIENFGLLLVNDTGYINEITASENSQHAYLEITYIEGCACDNSADFNYDCVVNLTDFSRLAAEWEQGSEEFDLAPPVGDGFVGLADLAEFADQWLLECLGSGGGEGEGEGEGEGGGEGFGEE